MRELLAKQGYDVDTASTAEEAEDKILQQRPDLMLLDVVMPGKSGYDLCRELKEDDDTRLIPIVMITGLTIAKTGCVVSSRAQMIFSVSQSFPKNSSHESNRCSS